MNEKGPRLGAFLLCLVRSPRPITTVWGNGTEHYADIFPPALFSKELIQSAQIPNPIFFFAAFETTRPLPSRS